MPGDPRQHPRRHEPRLEERGHFLNRAKRLAQLFEKHHARHFFDRRLRQKTLRRDDRLDPRLFDRGGRIPAGGWGIVGERGPEIVRGPANVTGRQDTAQMMSGTTIGMKSNQFQGLWSFALDRAVVGASGSGAAM